MTTNSQLEKYELDKAKLDKEIQEVSSPSEERVQDNLASHVKNAWEKAAQEKIKFHQKMVANLDQIHGIYSEDKLAAVRELGSEIYPLVTDVKTRTAVAIIRKILREKPWEIEPTPMPSLAPDMEKQAEMIFMRETTTWMQELQQQGQISQDPTLIPRLMEEMLPKFKKKFLSIKKQIAKEKASLMEKKMEDQLIEGGFYKAMSEMTEDLVKLKAGIIKKTYRKKTIRTLTQGPNGKAVVGTKDEIIPEWDAPSPFDIFPLPGSSDINRGGLIHRLKYTRADLQSLKGVEGFDVSKIDEILDRFTDSGLHEWSWNTFDTERIEAEGGEPSQYYDWENIECLEYHNAVPGSLLIEFAGITLKPLGESQVEKITLSEQEYDIDRSLDYNAIVWLIDQWVIKVSLNDNPIGTKPFWKASYVGEKGSFWGRGLPETMPDSQQMACQSRRALQNNIGIASGPLLAYDKTALPPGVAFPDRITPWMILPMMRKMFSSSEQKLIEFYQANMHAQELDMVYKGCLEEADSRSGVAGYAHGSRSIGGAGNTLGGMSLFMGQQGVGIEDILGEIDENIIEPCLIDLYWDNYELDDALEYIGDVKIRAKGSRIVMQKQQQALRLTDWLRATANPIDAQLTGMEGRGYILKETAKNMGLDEDRAVPDPDMIKPLAMPQQEGQGMSPVPGGTSLDVAGNLSQGIENKLPQSSTGG